MGKTGARVRCWVTHLLWGCSGGEWLTKCPSMSLQVQSLLAESSSAAGGCFCDSSDGTGVEFPQRAVFSDSCVGIWGRGWVIDCSSDVSMGFVGGQAEAVDALWAMRGWKAIPTCRRNIPMSLGGDITPAAIAGETQALLASFFHYSLTRKSSHILSVTSLGSQL